MKVAPKSLSRRFHWYYVQKDLFRTGGLACINVRNDAEVSHVGDASGQFGAGTTGV
jgi:hypothetical protein